MKTIYLDNSATTFPKPESVAAAVENYIRNIGANPGRGAYGASLEAGRTALKLRMAACRLFNFDRPDHVVITPGATAGLNMVIKGLLKPGDHVIVTPMQHNSVMRPIRQLEKQGVAVDLLPFNDSSALHGLIKKETKLVVACHGSNVSGSLEDIEAIGKICKEKNIFFLVDAAQTAGHYPIDFKACNMSALAMPGHKGLMGPQGIGLLLVDPKLAEQLDPLICGGTGSASDLEEMPAFMPDKFEAGTLNVPGIFGLEASLRFIEEKGIKAIHAHTIELEERFRAGIAGISGVTAVGENFGCGVISLDFEGQDNASLSAALEQDYGILTRCGLHCAPSAHKILNTFPRGTVRFSLSYINTQEDVDAAVSAVKEICG